MSEYHVNLNLWNEHQADLLRRRAAGALVNEAEFDWLNTAEEIESVGANTRRELCNRLPRLSQHLLKRHFQPDLRSRSWRLTIAEQRDAIKELLAEKPLAAGWAAGEISGALCQRATRGRL